MKKRASLLLLAAAVTAFVTACATSPLGRRQINIFSDGQLAEMGAASFNQLKSKTPQTNNPRHNQYVRCIADAITNSLQGNWRGGWEVQVFEDDSANAFALPGKKIGVHTGIFKVARNEHQLATVMGHEVAHVLAKHGNERVSQGLIAEAGLNIANAIYGGTAAGQRTMALLGLGTQVGILLPYGRVQESEADLLGLDLMAQAGFDPRESVKVWQNMGKESSGKQPPEFLSTHPAHGTRINHLNERMPHAMQLFQQAQARGLRPNCQG